MNDQPSKHLKPVDQATWNRIKELGILRNFRGTRGRGSTLIKRSNFNSTSKKKLEFKKPVNIQEQAITEVKRSEEAPLKKN